MRKLSEKYKNFSFNKKVWNCSKKCHNYILRKLSVLNKNFREEKCVAETEHDDKNIRQGQTFPDLLLSFLFQNAVTICDSFLLLIYFTFTFCHVLKIVVKNTLYVWYIAITCIYFKEIILLYYLIICTGRKSIQLYTMQHKVYIS